MGAGGAKAKFRANMAAINLLKELEFEGAQATPEQQEVLSRYVGWGGLADAFYESKENWKDEFVELYTALSPEEYAAARASTLNAHYTSPTVIKAIYEVVDGMGFQTGNILEPAMGVGNFFGLLPQEMQSSRLYGVELDSITGRIARQLYPKADITVAGFETADRRDSVKQSSSSEAMVSDQNHSAENAIAQAERMIQNANSDHSAQFVVNAHPGVHEENGHRRLCGEARPAGAAGAGIAAAVFLQ